MRQLCGSVWRFRSFRLTLFFSCKIWHTHALSNKQLGERDQKKGLGVLSVWSAMRKLTRRFESGLLKGRKRDAGARSFAGAVITVTHSRIKVERFGADREIQFP